MGLLSKSKVKFYLLAVSLLTCGYARASEFQVFSVKENPAGTIVATIGVFTGDTPAASAFKLKLDDKNVIPAREVKPAATSELPTSIILCVDQSSSMGSSRIRQIQEALRGVLGKSELKLNLALWAFDTEVRKLRGFSQDATQLARSVGEIGLKSKQDSKTKLFEAIELGLSELRSRDDKGLKRLIVITDGKDDGSSITEQVIASKANAQNISIDAIGFGNVADTDAQLLAGLTKNTGGHFILAKNAQELLRELYKLFNLPAPRMFDVLFSYEVSGDRHQVNSAQLEFTPTGKAPVFQAIVYGISAPRIADSSTPTSGHKNSEGNFDMGTLLGILIGIAVAVVIYVMIKKRPSPPPPPPPPPLPSPSVPPAPPLPPKRARTSVGFAFPTPGPGRPAAFLYCLSGPAKGRQYPIEQENYRIGSGEANELQLSDDYLSHRHASITYDSGNLYLSDSESRNGTYLNDARLDQTARALSPGDRIQVGKSTLELLAPDENHASRTLHGDEGESLVP